MSELGELLVLLHGARDRVSSVRAVVRTWRHAARAHEATERWAAQHGGVTSYAPLGVARETYESVIRLWLAPPERVREEREGDDGPSIGVRRGDLWWRYDPRNGAVSNEMQPHVGSGIGAELRWMFDPAAAIGLLQFGAITRRRRAGRAAVRVRAVPRAQGEGSDFALLRLGAVGADELLLDVDAERGVLLRVECRLDGKPFAITEALEIAFDEQFPEDTFVFTPPPGEEVRPYPLHTPVLHDLTIVHAARLAPFTVWVPARVPRGWEITIGFAEGHERPPVAPHVFLHYRAPDGLHGFTLTQSPADQPADEEAVSPGSPWRELVRADRRMEVREPLESWQPAQVRMELDGTRVLIRSDELGGDTLADVAAALVPAPSEPPRLGG